MTSLLRAITAKDAAACRYLLAGNATLANFRTSHDRSALLLACTLGNVEVVRTILEFAPRSVKDRDMYGNSALDLAAVTGSVDICRLLLEEQDVHVDATQNREGLTPLMRAVSMDHLAVAELLIEHGANLHHRSSSKQTPASIAVTRGRVTSLHLLINAGIDIQNDERYADLLYMAVLTAQPKVIEALLTCGADARRLVRGGEELLNCLMVACKSRLTYKCAHALLPHSDVNAQDAQGNTALHYVLQRTPARSITSDNDTYELVKALLVDFGAVVNIVNHAGQLAEHMTEQEDDLPAPLAQLFADAHARHGSRTKAARRA